MRIGERILAAVVVLALVIPASPGVVSAAADLVGAWEGTARVAWPGGYALYDVTVTVTEQHRKLFNGTLSRQAVGAPVSENFGLTGCVIGDQVEMTAYELGLDNVTECFMDATYSSVKDTLKGMGRSPNGSTFYFSLQRQ